MSSNKNAPKEDIRGQLSDIQKRLFSKKSDKSLRPSNTEKFPKNDQENLIQLPPLPKKPQAPLQLRGLIPGQSTSLGPESKGNDMNFVVGLSENLLSECRRLTAENQKYKTKLKSSVDEIQVFKSEIFKLKNSRTFQINNESDLKDKNWELESNLMNLNDQVSTLEVGKEKMIKLNQELQVKLASLQKENDDLAVKTQSMSKNYDNLKTSFSKEISDLNNKIEELNDENDLLHLKLSIKDSKNVSLVSSEDPSRTALTIGDDSDEESLDFDSILLDAQPRELPTIDPRNPQLEAETLRATLNHSNRIIAKLRSALLKSRDALLNTPNKLPLLKPNKKMMSINDIKPANRSSLISPSKRNSKFLIHNDELETSAPFPNESGNWEDFIGDGIQTTPSRPPKIPAAVGAMSDVSSTNSKRSVNVTATDNFDIPCMTQSDSSDSETEIMNSPSAKPLLSRELLNSSLNSKKQIEEYANDNNMILIPVEKYEKLAENDVHALTNQRLVEVANEKGYIALSKLEHASLVDENQMRKKLESSGLITIPLTEHKELKDTLNAYEHPTIEYLSEKAKNEEYELVSQAELSKLNKGYDTFTNPSENYLLSKCDLFNLHALSDVEFKQYQAVLAQHEIPEKAHLMEKANKLGLIVASSAYYDELTKLAHEPSVEHINQKAIEHNLVTIPKDEYSALVAPSLKSISDRAGILDAVVLTKPQYNDLMEPTLDQIATKSATHDHRLLSNDEYEQLQASHNTPTIEHIISKAKDLNFTVVEDTEYERLQKTATDPPLNHVKLLADKHNLVTLSKPEYTDLFKLANEPTTEHLKNKADSKGMTLVKCEEYENLNQLVNQPHIEHISKKATDLGFVVVEKDDYDSTLSMANDPTVDHMISKAKIHDHILIPSKEYESLTSLAESPTLEHLHSKVSKYDHVLLPAVEHSELQQLAHSPSIDHIKSKMPDLKHTILSNEEHELMTNLANSPGIEHIKSKAIEHDHVIVPKVEFDSLSNLANEPSIDRLKELSAKYDLELVEKSELEKLSKLANEPEIDHITTRASALSHVVIPLKEHEILTSKANTPDIDHIVESAKSKGYTVVKDDRYNKLIEDSENTSFDHLSIKAGHLGYSIIKTNEFESIKSDANNPSLDHVRAKAEQLNHTVVDIEDFKTLDNNANSPDIDHIKSQAAKYQLSVIPSDELSRLTDLAHSPTLDHLTENAKSRNLILLSSTEHESLLKLANSPTRDHLESKSAEHGLVLIDSKEHADLQKKLASPTKEFITEKASQLDLVTVPKSDYQAIELLAQSPSIEHISSKAKDLNYAILPEEELKTLKLSIYAPSIGYLTEKAADNKMKLLEDQEHERLAVLANSPSIEHLTEKASALGMTLIQNEKLQNIETDANSPSLDHLKEKAATMDMIVTEKSSYENMKQLANQPDLTHIEKVAGKLQHVVIPHLEHKELQDKALSPDAAHIYSHAERLGLHPLTSDEFNVLSDKAEHPSLDHVKERAQDHHMTVVDNTEFERLNELAYKPSKEHITNKAKGFNLAVIDEQELQSVQMLAHDPPLEHLNEKALSLGQVTISKEDHSKLLKPTTDDLKHHALSLNHKLVPDEEYQALKETSEMPSKDFILSKIENYGLTAIPSREHTELLNKANEPSKEHILEKSAAVGLISLPKHKHEQLLSKIDKPSRDYLVGKSHEMDLQVIPSKELESLKNAVESPSIDYLVLKATSFNSVVVDKENYESLKNDLEKPTTEYLSEKASLANQKLVSVKEYNNLVRAAKEPKLDEITTHASKHEHVLIPESEHNQLLKSINDPSLDFLKLKSEKLNYSVISNQDYSNLTDIISSPSREHIEEKAESAGLIVVPKDVYEEILQKAKSPSKEVIVSNAALFELKAIPIATCEMMEKSIESPSTEYLTKHANEKGYEIIESSLVSTLRDNLENPSMEHLTEKAAKYDFSLVPIGKLKELENISDSPSIDFLKAKASTANYIVLPKSEHLELKTMVERPDIDYLKSKGAEMKLTVIPEEEYDTMVDPTREQISTLATKSGLVAVDKTEYDTLQKKITAPSVEYLQEKAKNSGHTVIATSTLENLNTKLDSPTESYLNDKASVLGYKLLLKDEYENLHNLAHNPSHEHIKNAGSLLGLTVLGVAAHKELTSMANKPSIEHITEKAKYHKHVVLPKPEHDELVEKASKPLKDLAEESGMVLIQSGALESLKKSIESPSVDYLKQKVGDRDFAMMTVEEEKELRSEASKSAVQKAAENNLKAIPQEDFDDLNAKISDPSLEYLKKKSLDHGLELVESDELKELQTYKSRSIQELAGDCGFVALTKSEYSALTDLVNSPPVDHLSQKAMAIGHVVLPKSEHHDLVSMKASPPFEFLCDKLSNHEHVAIPITEHNALKDSFEESLNEKAAKEEMKLLPFSDYELLKSNVESPSLDYLSSKAGEHDSVIVPITDYESLKYGANQSLEEKAHGNGMVVVSKDAYDNLTNMVENPAIEQVSIAAASLGYSTIENSELERLRQQMADPSIDYIKEKAKIGGYLLLNQQEFDVMQTRANKSIEELALEKSMQVIPLEEYKDLQSSVAELQEGKARAVGTVIVNNSEYDLLMSQANTPTLEHLTKHAQMNGHVLIHQAELESLKLKSEETLESKATSRNMKVIPMSDFDLLYNKSENPDLDHIKSKVSNHGHSVVETPYLESLLESHNTSLEEKAAKLDQKVVSLQEYGELANPSMISLKSHATSNGCILLPTGEFDKLERLVQEPISDRAKREGMALLTEEELDTLNAKITNPSLETLKASAAKLQHTVVTNQDFEDLNSRANETLEDKIEGTHQKLISETEYDNLLIQANKPTIDSIKQNAGLNGLVTVPIDEFESMKAIAQQPIQQRAETEGLVVIEKSEYDAIVQKSTKPSHEHLGLLASAVGMHMLPIENFKKLETASNKSINTLASEHGKVLVGEADFKQRDDELNSLKKILKERELSLDNAAGIEIAKSRLSELGWMVISTSDYNNLKGMRNSKRFSRGSEDHYADAEESFIFSPEELQFSAEKLGMVVLSQEEYEELNKVDLDTVKAYADRESLSIIPSPQLLQLKQSIAEKDSQIFKMGENSQQEPTREFLAEKLSDIGLVMLDKEEYQELKFLSLVPHKVINEQDLKVRATELGLNVIDQDQFDKYQQLTKQCDELSTKCDDLSEKYDDLSVSVLDHDKFSSLGKSLGLLCIPSTEYIATTSTPTPDVSNIKVLPSSYYQQLLKFKSLSIDRVSDETFKKYAETRGFKHKDDIVTPVLPHTTSFMNMNENTPPDRGIAEHNKFTPPSSANILRNTPLSAQSKPFASLPTSDSVRSNLSQYSNPHSIADSLQSVAGFSMATNVSLTDRSMIPAITQVVIGEYLFKYYRRLGPLSSISETRHERYFWVHPYTLTLYWSESNPVLSNPAAVRTRAAAIVSVQSIEDNNPLPTGLYHKSIVINSQDKSIKITCATRQRHNIWYNALRYLISRNIDDLTFDTENTEDDIQPSTDMSPPSQRKSEPLFDTADRHAYPRPRVTSTTSQIMRSPSANKLSRFSSIRK